METSRKKALELMQKGIVSYKIIKEGWDVSNHFGDGYDLIAEKNNKIIRLELKSIDLDSIKEGNNATQHVSANEIVSATHLIVTLFRTISLESNFIMTIRQFIENSGAKKYKQYMSYESFLSEYKKLSKDKSELRKNSNKTIPRLDFSFNPEHIENWKLYKFNNMWENLEK